MTQPIDQRTLELALQHHQAGRLHEAEPLYRQVLTSQPSNPDALNLLGVLLHQTGRSHDALRLIDQAVQLNPQSPLFFNNQGLVLIALQRFEEAEAAYRRAVVLQPDYADALYSLAWLLERKELPEEALAAYGRVLRVRPDYLAAYNNSGNILSKLKRWDEAVATFRKAIAINPSYADAHINLGSTLKAQGKLDEALAAYQNAIALQPAFAEAHNNLGNVFHQLGQTHEAVAAYRRAIALRSDLASAYQNIAQALFELQEIDESIAASREAIRIDPNLPGAHNNLGNALKETGRLDEAIEAFRKAVALSGEAYAQTNLMLAITFHPDYQPQQIYQEHVRWNEQFAKHLAPRSLSYANAPVAERRIRVGYVGAYFRDHCQSFFTVPLLSHHDHQRFEIYVYADVPKPDAITGRIRGSADAWRDVSGMTDAQIAEAVREDRIDILVDLALHMEHGRMLAFAEKPAPVQVTWLGYPGTTGLTTMDYRLSDPQLDPGFDDAFYSEKTIRLPSSFWCYDPLTTEPPVNRLPALSRGHITFGCLNNLNKATARTFSIWAKVLLATPSAQLRLLAPQESGRQRAIQLLAQHGVPAHRIEFVSWLPRPQYLAEYHRIDIALDPFPCPGHTTSLDALWMGVPVVNLPGATAVARGGASILTSVGLAELIARDERQYVTIATELAGDLTRLSALRQTLRKRIENSPLMDAPRFAADIEAAFTDMWITWCKSQV